MSDDDTGRTEPPKTSTAGSELVSRDMVKEIMMKVLSGLQESSSKQSGNDGAIGKEAGSIGKYRLVPGYPEYKF